MENEEALLAYSPRAVLLTLADGTHVDAWCRDWHHAQSFLAWIPVQQKAGNERALQIVRAKIQPVRITLG